MPEPSYRLLWSPTALNDLAEIWTYLAGEASDAIAAAQMQKLNARCDALTAFPFSGRSRDELKPGLRAVVASPYVVLYRVSDESVEIMHIVHGRRDIAAVVADDD
jgi:toxin ParE1/3/4